MAKGQELDRTILEAALDGLQHRLQDINSKIADVQKLLGRRAQPAVAPVAAEAPAPKKKRTMSAAAKRRIAAAQRKRWAEFRARTQQKAARKKAKAAVKEAATE